MLNDEELSSVPLVALQRVEKGNFFQISKDYILKLFD